MPTYRNVTSTTLVFPTLQDPDTKRTLVLAPGQKVDLSRSVDVAGLELVKPPKPPKSPSPAKPAPQSTAKKPDAGASVPPKE